MKCENCGCTDLQHKWDNGAEYPQTRVECYECAQCGSDKRVVLTA